MFSNFSIDPPARNRARISNRGGRNGGATATRTRPTRIQKPPAKIGAERNRPNGHRARARTPNGRRKSSQSKCGRGKGKFGEEN